jgi:hypothetical protein
MSPYLQPPSVATDPRVAELHSLALAAAELVDEIGDLAEWDQANRAAGYRLAARTFFRHGVEVGREQVLAAIIDGQDDTRRRLARLAREPAWTELERMRRQPGGKLWTDNLAAHGGREYTGGPVPQW